KLAVFDTWSALAVHVAMDNTVVMEDISNRVALVAVVRQLCPPPADLPAARPGEELIYLDPHTTQPALQAAEHCPIPDESFHCQHPPSRMSIAELDPSIAVGFFCGTEDDFNDWCQQVRKLSLLGGALPMFELVERQPSHLACPDVLNLSLDSSDVERLERFFDSEDEDFEILSL
ncbi:Cysteine protease ATG4B, partial [Eschrichtius robustus]|nr:Cysteine protease ATG4B [Eschrichtius robustus]